MAAMRFETEAYRPIDFPVDIKARFAAIPPDIMQKGMFFSTLAARLTPAEYAAIKPKLTAPPKLGAYIPFGDYPMKDYFYFFEAMVNKRPAGTSVAEGARLIGRELSTSFFDSRFGSVLKSLARDPSEILLKLPATMDAIFTGIQAKAERLGDSHVKLSISNNRYGFSESVFVGSFEGWVIPFGKSPRMKVVIQPNDDATYEISW